MTPAQELEPGCAPCGRAWDHCHGSWVLHTDGTGECTDVEGSHLPPETHDVVLPCCEVDSGCCA